MRMRPDIHRQAPLVFMREVVALEPGIRTVMLEPGEGLVLNDHIGAEPLDGPSAPHRGSA
jgi:hypothetical protein